MATNYHCFIVTGSGRSDFREDRLEQMSVTTGSEDGAPTITSGSKDTLALLALDAQDLKRYRKVKTMA